MNDKKGTHFDCDRKWDYSDPPTKVEGICYESMDRVLEMILRSGETK